MDSSNSGIRLEEIILGTKINTGGLEKTGQGTKELEWHSLNKCSGMPREHWNTSRKLVAGSP
jgi:hypothetical protein